ncbi:MAG: MarR family winged helix-turn-helix transcriptional regulator [Methanobrevibacter wolinii]|uniref:MarR family winged helix-turn-helix transcriptional regulator n=1 Tax=Methanobrevibacter wolinii TaxID=190977 RepID=UPI0005B278D4|nr:MarR family transcriptional regulator [Methanobrevibacter wolinii]MDD5959883.1 MarR family transcriptional regulator [Methanobrevibacter wolinii]
MSFDKFKEVDASKVPLGTYIQIISKAYSKYLNYKFNDIGLNSTQVNILFQIHFKYNLNQEEIAKRCNINKGAVARSLKKLEDEGYLIREVDEDNRRQNKIKLTEKGEKNFKKIKEISLNYESKVLENLDDKQIRELKKLLKSIAIETNKIKENRSK